MPRKSVTIGVSLSPELRAQAVARAENLGLSFSAYIQSLVRRDLSERGPLQISEHPPVYPQETGSALDPYRSKPRSKLRRKRPSQPRQTDSGAS